MPRFRRHLDSPRPQHKGIISISRTASFGGVVAAALLATTPQATLSTAAGPYVAQPNAALTVAESRASALAAKSGEPTPVVDSVTATSQVLANPDGTFTLQASVKPVRVPASLATEDGLDPDGDGWVPVDTSLHLATTGRLEPKAAATGLSLSPGGDTSIVTVTSEAGSSSADSSPDTLSLKWPSALPIPSVEGSTATYPDVMPGVDLAVTAHADSYSEVLVVKTAEAAANPKLTHLGFGLDLSSNLQITEAGGQSISATDGSTGQQIFASATPVMWDSSADPHLGPAPTATDPGGSAPTPLDVSVTQSSAENSSGIDATVSVAVPAAELTGSAVTYPVFIDPNIAKPDQASINEQSNGVSYWQPTDFLRAGLCGWSGCNPYNHIDRSFSAFDVHELTGRATTAVVSSGRVYAREVWNAGGCTSANVGLWSAHGINPSTVWNDNTAISLLQTIDTAAGGGTSCQAADLRFADGGVTARFQEAATKDVQQLVFGFLAYDEGNRNAWKKFDINPKIEVDYSFPPTAPTSLAAANTTVCDGTIYEPKASHGLSAISTDVNSPAGNMNTVFRLYNANTNALLAASGPVNKPSGQVAGWNTPSLAEGSYYFTAAATNTASQTSAASRSGTYVIDTTPPSAPKLSDMYSFALPLKGTTNQIYGDAVGTTPAGSIHVYAADADGFVFKFGSAPTSVSSTEHCADTDLANGIIHAVNGAADIPIPVDITKGSKIFYVESLDNAHNTSAATTAAVLVAPRDGTTIVQGETGAFTTQSATGGSIPNYRETTAATSGGAQQHFVTKQKDDQVTYTVTAPRDGAYEIMLEAYTSDHAGTVTTWLDGVKQGRTVDLYTGPVAGLKQERIFSLTNSDPDDVTGIVTPGLTKGTHTITLKIAETKNSDSVNYNDSKGGNDYGNSIAVDYIRLTNLDPPAGTDTLNAGTPLDPGDHLWSPNGAYEFILQTDGNAVVYRAGVGAIWSTNTSGNAGTHLTLQSDGNLVLYGSASQALWYNSASSSAATTLKMQDDGNLVEYTSSGTVLWSSKGGLVK